MIHLRIVAHASLAGRAVDVLERTPSVLNIVRIPDVARKPHGDLILCDVAREDASVLIAELRGLGVDHAGTIAIEEVDTAISDAAREARRLPAAIRPMPSSGRRWSRARRRAPSSRAPSSPSWCSRPRSPARWHPDRLADPDHRRHGRRAGVRPARRRFRRDRPAEAGPGAALAARARGRLPGGDRRHLPRHPRPARRRTGAGRAHEGTHPATLFISNPNTYSVIVALLAGTAGVLSLTTAKSGALIGVLISVTTIPAAANVGVAAYADWSEVGGALAQLLINLSAIVAAGVATLSFQRALFARRAARSGRPSSPR